MAKTECCCPLASKLGDRWPWNLGNLAVLQPGPNRARCRSVRSGSSAFGSIGFESEQILTALIPLIRFDEAGKKGESRSEIPPTFSPRSTFRPRFHSPRHVFHQPMLHRSVTKFFQINALNLVGKIGQPSSFGENPPIRREKARPFHPRTIKVSGKKPASTREFPSPPRAESMFA